MSADQFATAGPVAPPTDLLPALWAASRLGFWVQDLETGQINLSDQVFSLLSQSRPSASPALLDLVWPADAADLAAWLQGFDHTTETRQADFRFTTPTDWRWIQLRGQLAATAGQPLRVVGTFDDITDAKLATAAQQAAEARWRSLADQAPLGITLLDRSGTVLYINRHEAESHQAPVVGCRWQDCLPFELASEAQWVLDRGLSGQPPFLFESYRTLANAEIRHFENHVSPLWEAGRVTGLVLASLDKTAEYAARHRQAKAQKRMEILLQWHNDSTASPDQILAAVSAAACLVTDSPLAYLWRFSSDTAQFDLVSASFHGSPLVFPDGLPTFSLGDRSPLDAVVRSKTNLVINDVVGAAVLPLAPLVPPVILRRCLLLPVLDQDRVVAVLGVGNQVLPYTEADCTELQTLADSLWYLHQKLTIEKTAQLLHRAVEGSPVSVLIADAHGQRLYANPRYDRTVEPAAAADRTAGYLFLPGSEPQTAQAVRESLAAGQNWQAEWSHPGADGKTATEWVTVSPVTGPTGETTHLVAILEDITERKAALDLLARAQKMETVGQLAAGVAHDFNNLLASVLGMNDMLLRKLEAGHELRKYAEMIDRAGRRAADLVAGLLAVGRQQRLTKSRQDLGQLLREEADLLTSLTHKQLRLVPPVTDTPLPVEVDPGQISQVVVNLISNARDALKTSGTTISLAWGRSPDDRTAWLTVSDDGPGIPAELLDRIFDPFFTTKPIGQGTGLGLAIVQGIIHQHQGSISVSSPPGQGTRFLVELPLLPAVEV